MPIRFRCVFCNQLMGISRRKAGTMVRCPVCASSVNVPTDSIEEPAAGPPLAGRKRVRPESPPPFERSDFDQILHEPVRRAPVEVLAAGREDFGLPGELTINGPPIAEIASPPAPSGILLTQRRAIVISVVAVIALALVFALGYWLGVSTRS